MTDNTFSQGQSKTTATDAFLQSAGGVVGQAAAGQLAAEILKKLGPKATICLFVGVLIGASFHFCWLGEFPWGVKAKLNELKKKDKDLSNAMKRIATLEKEKRLLKEQLTKKAQKSSIQKPKKQTFHEWRKIIVRRGDGMIRIKKRIWRRHGQRVTNSQLKEWNKDLDLDYLDPGNVIRWKLKRVVIAGE